MSGGSGTGISLSGITGTLAAVISGNILDPVGPVADGMYGYSVYNLNTTPKTIITGGTITNFTTGIVVSNSASGPVYAPSTLVSVVSP